MSELAFLTFEQWVIMKIRAFEAGFEGREFNFGRVGPIYSPSARKAYADGRRTRIKSERDCDKRRV